MTDQLNHHPLTPDTAAHLIARAEQIAPAALKAIETYRALVAEITNLEQAGITNASVYMRNETYMYLIHPTQPDGTRKREYIGADPTKQADARARLDRYEQHQNLTRQANRARSEIEQAVYSLDRIIRDLKGI